MTGADLRAGTEPTPTDVKLPGLLPLTWLLFMQPIRLHLLLKGWGLDPAGNPSSWWRQGAVGRALLARMATLLVVATPLLAVGVTVLCQAVDYPVDWLSVAVGVAVGVAFGVASGVALGVASGVALGVAYFRLPLYLAESIHVSCLSRLARWGFVRQKSALRWLPYRIHDLIWFPLPGLRAFVVHVAKTDPDRAQSLIDECAATLGQKGVARRALADLQASTLSGIARDRRFATLKQGEAPFVPANPPPDSPFAALMAAAVELGAAQLSHHQHHRAQLLGRAEQLLRDENNRLIQRARPNYLARRLQPVTQQWLDVIKDEQARLKQEQAARPQLPDCFVAGPALRREPGTPFKGRRDLALLVEHELGSEQRGPLEPPPEGPWGPALDWLQTVDRRLVAAKERLLVAVDEVERLEDEIRAGQTNHDFLDFVRAAGDRLERIRFLLVSGLPLERLGAHWVDRVISAKQYKLGYLEGDAADELVRRPVPEFPDIYPEGGVEHILRQTNRHPYLIQLVCDQLVRRLNGQQRLKAEMSDLEWAIDEAFTNTALFSELYERQLLPREQDWLRQLTRGKTDIEPDGALRALEQHQFVVKQNGHYRIAVPMFESWIRENRLDNVSA